MKKIAFFAAAALVALSFTSCGGNSTNNAEAEQDTVEVKSFEQSQIEARIKVEIDSIAHVYSALKPLGIFEEAADGSLKLTDDEKKVKPEYLLAPAAANDLQTLSQKYRALAMLSIDQAVAKAYDMPVEEYKEAVAKLGADINDAALDVLVSKAEASDFQSGLEDFYNAEEENGRINYYWNLVAASVVEQLYVASQNIDKFIGSFDDESAENLTFHIAVLQNALQNLSAYDPELVELTESIEPLKVLNAIDVATFKTQLETAKADIEAVRANLLK